MKNNKTYLDLEKELLEIRNPEKAKFFSRYFKTGKGEYGEGIKFLGITVPQTKTVAKNYYNLSLLDIKKLLEGEFHEYGWAANMILVRTYEKSKVEEKSKIADFYLKNTKLFNNWDLVDVSAPKVLGEWLSDRVRDREVLYKFARSENLWERRISIMATLAFIRKNDFKDALAISEILLNDREDLIHKAVGWMLREVGKRNMAVEEKFLEKYCTKIPRTMLRYAIEKFPKEKREYFLIKR